MPFKSVKQREWLKINKPEIYRRWKKKYGLKVRSSVKKRYGRGKRRKTAK